jgi:hypothetical protein
MTHVCNPSIRFILGDALPRARRRAMSALMSWGLALAALVAGFVAYGWRGVVMAFSVIVFWLLLQFSRALRTMRAAAGRPVGTVKSAVMLHSKLHAGMRLMHLIKLTQSLGRPLNNEAGKDPERFAWADEGGDAVEVELIAGKLTSWRLVRADSSTSEGADS